MDHPQEGELFSVGLDAAADGTEDTVQGIALLSRLKQTSLRQPSTSDQVPFSRPDRIEGTLKLTNHRHPKFLS